MDTVIANNTVVQSQDQVNSLYQEDRIFFCRTCNLKWPLWYKSARSHRCKACAEWKKSKTQTRHNGNYESSLTASFWTSYKMERKRLLAMKGYGLCPICEQERPVSEMRKSSTECRACCAELAQKRRLSNPRIALDRQEERRKAAAKKGRLYLTRELRLKAFELQNARNNLLSVIKAVHAKEKKKYSWPSSGVCWLWNKPSLSAAERYAIRYRIDPEFNTLERMRRQLNKKLKKDGIGDIMRGAINRGGESNAVAELLGYTIAELRSHLERQFTKGMTWERFSKGEIHIDHITPQSAFDLTNPDEWRKCWCLSNLRPLWARENLAKSNTQIYLI